MSSTTMPVLFVGHGSPMHAIEKNRWSEGFETLGRTIPQPKAIVSVSAHWFVDGTFVTGNEAPKTLHDFGGFPKPLYEIEYPAQGDAKLAQQLLRTLLEEQHRCDLRMDWGLDHGTWCVLKWMYPDADVPVVQLSLDRRAPMKTHLDIGRSLQPLREEGVLILGSGNIVHNLRDAFGRMQSGDLSTPSWSRAFDEVVKEAVLKHDTHTLVNAWSTNEGQMAHPTPDHYIPLLYTMGAATKEDLVMFSSEGFDLGSLSMRNIRFG